MTKETILELLGARPHVVVTMQEHLTAFPGRCLTKDEADLQHYLHKAGGPAHNPRGTDRDSQVKTFLDDNKLSFKMGATRVMFFRSIGSQMSPETVEVLKELDRELREEMKRCGVNQVNRGDSSPPAQNNRLGR